MKPPLPLSAASERLRGQRGFPGRVGRPRTRAVPAPVTVPLACEASALRQSPATSREVEPESAAAPLCPADVPVAKVATMPALPPRLLGLKAAAHYLSVSSWTVRGFIAAGKLEPVKLGMKKVLLDVHDLDELIARSKLAGRPA